MKYLANLQLLSVHAMYTIFFTHTQKQQIGTKKNNLLHIHVKFCCYCTKDDAIGQMGAFSFPFPFLQYETEIIIHSRHTRIIIVAVTHNYNYFVCVSMVRVRGANEFAPISNRFIMVCAGY